MITDKEIEALSGGMPYVKARITKRDSDGYFVFPTNYVGNCIYIKLYSEGKVFEEWILGFTWKHEWTTPVLTATVLGNEQFDEVIDRRIDAYYFNADGLDHSRIRLTDLLHFVDAIEVVYQNYRGINSVL